MKSLVRLFNAVRALSVCQQHPHLPSRLKLLHPLTQWAVKSIFPLSLDTLDLTLVDPQWIEAPMMSYLVNDTLIRPFLGPDMTDLEYQKK